MAESIIQRYRKTFCEDGKRLSTYLEPSKNIPHIYAHFSNLRGSSRTIGRIFEISCPLTLQRSVISYTSIVHIKYARENRKLLMQLFYWSILNAFNFPKANSSKQVLLLSRVSRICQQKVNVFRNTHRKIEMLIFYCFSIILAIPKELSSPTAFRIIYIYIDSPYPLSNAWCGFVFALTFQWKFNKDPFLRFMIFVSYLRLVFDYNGIWLFCCCCPFKQIFFKKFRYECGSLSSVSMSMHDK